MGHDLGSDFVFELTTRDDEPHGAIITGPAGPNCPHGYAGRCGGAIVFDGKQTPEDRERGRPGWTIESGDPESPETLTLEPSIVCKCQFQHGFVRAGKWVGA